MMASPMIEQTTIEPEASERDTYAQIAQVLAQPQVRILDPSGHETVIPPDLQDAIRTLADILAASKAVVVTALDKNLTTQQAADMLGVSRPYLVRLLESGAMPFTRVHSHRRIKYADLLAYRERQHREAREYLAALTQLNEEMGFYDAESAVITPKSA